MSESRSTDAADEWLVAIRKRIAQAAGLAPEELHLDQKTIDTVLDVARIAAHDSGDRRNAPLLCYLVGRAQQQVDVETLAGVVRKTE